ncbi:hypothetical protein DICVIV_05533 [Dictyocaulus viviparus]|uniref:CRAL-TRIO domain-containing protein n=1 Tax=Dictyocaulus viviparus TaxID=29172 RepID=A0A0D8XX16_DICVI|nr:hypothetical protein DICVIV_05533 [Dictyocaulus viviparus]
MHSKQIIVINAPKFINLLYHTCIPFIPSDYKKKITISSGDARETLLEHIDECCLPLELGGSCDMKSSGEYEIYLPIQQPLYPYPKSLPIDLTLEELTIPAGNAYV